jgi:hypothetical protein
MMKKGILAILFLFFAFSAQAFAAGADGRVWASEGLKTNPAANAMFADTGVLPSAEYSVFLMFSCSANTTVDFEAWKADLSAMINSQRFHLTARQPYTTRITVNYPIGQDVRMRLKNITAVTGEVQGAIIVE